LLVEDTRLYSVAVRDKLESFFGLEVIHCPTFAALKNALSEPNAEFSLAILDLCQADAADGEALDYVISRGIRPVVFSASSNNRRREEVLAKNVHEFVLKNSERSLDNLAATVDRILSLGKPEVLIVCPDLRYDSSFARLVEHANYSVSIMPSGEEALEFLDRARTVELVLLNVSVGDAEVAEFLDALKSRFGEDAARVIGYSDQNLPSQAGWFLKAGGDEFLSLPMSALDLESRLTHTLAIHQQIRSLRRMASRDFLTDMLNRRYFFDRGPKIVEMCIRQRMPVSAALLDIDHFKKLNDTYGHEVGDLVLKSVSRKMLSLVGEDKHLPARLGGEEFGILFTNLSIRAAYEFCERIRSEIAMTRIVVEEEEISVTVSMGLAEISGLESFDNYLNAADQYLYLAKHSGRNRVFSDYQVSQSVAS
jgi:diguanylate cyclase (GGDEF)-like protein